MAPKKGQGLSRASSKVNPYDKSGKVFKGFLVWTSNAPAVQEDPDLCFAKCMVLPGSTAEVFRCRQIEPADPQNREFDVPRDCAFNVNSTIDPLNFPDIGMAPHTNRAAVLDFLRQRYLEGQIYTGAMPLLVAINPFKDLGNTTDKVIKTYRDIDELDELPPHVFAVARVALENLHSVKKSQTIIVSGESGAGKTEATKQVMRYFAAAKSATSDSRIQKAVLAANPVLEAFGNAKTIRNNNSSRFGRFMQLQVAAGGGIEYGGVRSFLLEKSRILTQDSLERSYHIFYQLLKGASPAQRKQFHLRELQDYKFINPNALDSPGIDDIAEWAEIQQSFESMQISHEDRDSIFSIVSGVLLLGNVQIQSVEKAGVPDAASIDENNRALLKEACDLLFFDSKAVEEVVLVKISKAGKQEIRGFWRQSEASMLKDSLAKAMYDKLFAWIIRQLNATIEPSDGFQHFMAILDIFGFELFDNNSLEQLLINITNEVLQKNFTDAVFEREARLYRAEGISIPDIEWTSNIDLINMLTGKTQSLMAVLEDQCLAPGGTDEKFLASAYNALKDNTMFSKPRHSSNVNFIVDHTIGKITYNAAGFLFKNNDILRAEAVEVIQQSPNRVTAGMFEGTAVVKGKLGKGQLINSQFMAQLNSLMAVINATETHFIRCVKPNVDKAPLTFVPARVLEQLYSLSILEALQLRSLGYSYRRPFEEFVSQYRFVAPGIAKNEALEYKDRATGLINAAGISSGWTTGKSMVFMTQETVKELNLRQRQQLAVWDQLVELVEAMATKKQHRAAYDRALPGLVRLQARCRQLLHGKVAAPGHEVDVAGWR